MLLSFRNIQNKYDMNITGIIHIGAHRGQEISDYIDGGIQNIILFEPLSTNFSILERNLADANANISGHQVALGNDEKMVTMYLSDNEQMSSSILKPKKHLEQYPHISFDFKEEVNMFRLDDLDIDLSKYNFINIDVQGYELEVFKGAFETLKNINYIISEINRDEVYENCPHVNELDEYLSQFN